MVQDRRDAALLGEGWEWNTNLGDIGWSRSKEGTTNSRNREHELSVERIPN
jgi:hypothetical protein